MAATAKPAIRGDHRLHGVKAGHKGDHRLGRESRRGRRCEPKPAIEVITDSGAESPPVRRSSEPNRAAVRRRAPASPTATRSNRPLAVAATPWRSGRTWSITTASPPATRASGASSASCAAAPSPEARVVIETAPGEEAQVDYGDGPMVRDPQTGKYRRTRLFVLTLGYSRKSVRLLRVPLERADLGRAARAGVSPARRRHQRRRPRQPARRRAHAGHLRSRAQSALSRRARALRRRRAAVPRARSRSQRQGRSPASATRRRRR